MEGAASRASKAAIVLLFVVGQVVVHFALRDSVSVQAACGISHAAAYLALLWYFGRTLRAGREPFITRLARTVHGTLPPGIAQYTRGVTVAWSAFFAGQVIVSALLLAFAPFEYWSLFVNVLNTPLVVAMFACDQIARTIRFRGQPRVPIARILRAFVEVNSSPGGTRTR